MMEGTYPLLLDGSQAGEVRVRVEGGWTVFDVACESVTAGLVRVSVYGAGREGYLGVLAPEGEVLTLHRRLSRSDLRDFPTQIEYAGRAGEPCPEEAQNESDPAEAAAEPDKAPEPSDEPQQETPPGEADLYWYATTDGALVSFDGTENRIALPVGDARIPTGGGGRAETIEGWDYVVFREKNGRIEP